MHVVIEKASSGPWLTPVLVAIAALLSACVSTFVMLRQINMDRRAQASRLTWWTEEVNESIGLRDYADAGAGWELEGGPEELLGRAVISIVNSSSDCIYEVTLQLADVFPPNLMVTAITTNPCANVRQVGVIPPLTTFHFEIPRPLGETPTADIRSSTLLPYNLAVDHVRFRDRNGRLWKRYFDGRLVKQPRAAPATRPLYAN